MTIVSPGPVIELEAALLGTAWVGRRVKVDGVAWPVVSADLRFVAGEACTVTLTMFPGTVTLVEVRE